VTVVVVGFVVVETEKVDAAGLAEQVLGPLAVIVERHLQVWIVNLDDYNPTAVVVHQVVEQEQKHQRQFELGWDTESNPRMLDLEPKPEEGESKMLNQVHSRKLGIRRKATEISTWIYALSDNCFHIRISFII